MNLKNQCFAVSLVAALIISPATLADDDPVPDAAEAIACGSNDVRTVLGLLEGLAGTCTDGDYENGVFDAASAGPIECIGQACSQTLVILERQQLHGGQNAGAIPLPPEEVDGQPIQTPPVALPVSLVRDPEDSRGVCVVVLPDSTALPACIGLGPVLGPLVRGELPIDQIGGLNEETNSIPEGEYGQTPPLRIPAMEVEVSAQINWMEDKLYRQVRVGQTGAWSPVDALDPAALNWWALNGQDTKLVLEVIVYQDGAPEVGHSQVDYVPTIFMVEVPWAGQSVAAMLRTTGV